MVHCNRQKPAPGSLDQCDDLLPDKTIPKESTPVEQGRGGWGGKPAYVRIFVSIF